MTNLTYTPTLPRGFNECSIEYRKPDDALAEVLACLDSPLLVIDQTFQIQNANAAALDLLGCHRSQRDFRRFVVGSTVRRSEAMRAEAQAAIMAGVRTVLMLVHPAHKGLICSIKGMTAWRTDRSCALVALHPLGESSPEVAPFLRSMYGLSRAEAEIALAASTGLEVAQIGLQRKVSIHTLRAQIASIKAKMGASRMTEIAVAVAQIQGAALI